MTEDVQHTVFIPAITLRYIGSFSIGPDQPRQLEAQIGVSHSATQAEIDEKLDMVARAFDRQAAHYLLKQAAETFERETASLEHVQTMLHNQEVISKANWTASGRKGEWNLERMPAGELAARKNIEQTMEKHRYAAQRAERTLQELKGVLNGGARDNHGSSDRHSGMCQG